MCIHEALASSFLSGLPREMRTQISPGTNGSFSSPGGPPCNLSLWQTVTDIVLVASQFPDTDILVQDPPGFGARWRRALFRQNDTNESDAQVLD